MRYGKASAGGMEKRLEYGMERKPTGGMAKRPALGMRHIVVERLRFLEFRVERGLRQLFSGPLEDVFFYLREGTQRRHLWPRCHAQRCSA